MDLKSFYAKLYGLDALLRLEGMPSGPDVWQSVFLLLERLERQQGRLPDDERQLASLLGPLFCRYPEDQARFPVLFEQCLSEEGPAIASVNRITSPEQAVIAAVRAKLKRTGWYWLAGTLLLIGISVAVLVYKETGKPVQPRLPDQTRTDQGKKPVQPPEAGPTIAIVDLVMPRLQPEPPSKALENIVRTSLNWLPWCFALLWLARKYYRRWILNRQAASGDDLFNHFRFERVLTPIFGGAEAERALRDLRAARFQTTRRLDMAATVEATARSGDFFHPVYRSRRFASEHLLLVRSQHRDDLQAALAEELVERFKKLGLTVRAYRFRDDPRRLVRWNENGDEYLELKQLAARHSAARLLVISETDILFHPFSGEVRPWLQDFAHWQDRVWLHPRDAGREHAALLGRSHFLLFPFTRDSLPELVARLTAQEPAPFTPDPVHPLPLPDLLAAEPDAWLADKPPYDANLSELIRQLELFLGIYGLRLLRAVAVYPKPHWPLTQALDYLLFGHLKTADPPQRREQRLARLSRLPWLTHAYLPDWLREHLLLGMDNAERKLITGVWRRLFGQLTDIEGPGSLNLEIRTPSKQRIKFRLADFRSLKNSENLNDPIFANILLGGKLGLLDFRLPRAMARLLPGTRQWLYVRPALTALVLAGFSVWGFNQGWQPYGQPALSRFEKSWFEHQNAAWRVAIDYQADAGMLANGLQKTLAAAQFQTADPQANVQTDSDQNSILYAAGGKGVAQRVAETLAWQTYGAAVESSESSALPANTIKVQLNQTYQHTAGFNDELRHPYQKPEKPLELKPSNSYPIEPDMVVIKPGKFLMGSSEKEPGRDSDEGPQHAVNIAYPFAIGKTEVTFAEYDRFAEATGRIKPDDQGWGLDKRPVINVSFNDAQAYVRWLAQQTGKNYRLPTEAEWEYAARAGSQTAYWWGDNIGKNHANCDGCGSQWDGKQTAPVGSFKANPFGLFDSAGNVWEWTQDCWHDSYKNAPPDGSAWLEADGGECGRRVVRGGSWGGIPRFLRSANRNWIDSVEANLNLGFRVARAL